MRIFISAGEPSGDLHAGSLTKEIRRRAPGAEILGYGGPEFQAAGGELLYPLTELAVMWFGRVLLNLDKFSAVLKQAERVFDERRPDAVVLIDYPGLHWMIARRAKARGIPVFYFVPPQIWAWAGWRVKKIKRDFAKVLCSLPFEPEWYRERGFLSAEYIGHPYFDHLGDRALDEEAVCRIRASGKSVVAMLPGSRTQEVRGNFPMMLRAARELSAREPGARFHVACFRERHREMISEMIAESGGTAGLPIELHVERTAEIIRAADAAWAVSGSVGLELLADCVPTVVVYRIKPFDKWVAKKFIKSKYISLVNLIAGEEVFPEYLTDVDVSREMADHAGRWHADPAARAASREKLAGLRDRVAKPGATAIAAEAILRHLAEARPTVHAPHLAGPRVKAHTTESGG